MKSLQKMLRWRRESINFYAIDVGCVRTPDSRNELRACPVSNCQAFASIPSPNSNAIATTTVPLSMTQPLLQYSSPHCHYPATLRH